MSKIEKGEISELLGLDWSVLGYGGEVTNFSDVKALLQAQTESDAKSAYWNLDLTVCKNDVVFESGLNVLKAILANLSSSTGIARYYCLNLLVEICCCQISAGSQDLPRLCLKELKKFTVQIFEGLQHGDTRYSMSYVDLLEILAEDDHELKPVFVPYIEAVLKKPLPSFDRGRIEGLLQRMK